MILPCMSGREEQAVPEQGGGGWPRGYSPMEWPWNEMPVCPLWSGVLGICLEDCREASGYHGESPWSSDLEVGRELWWCLQIRWAEAVWRWHQGQRSTVCPG